MHPLQQHYAGGSNAALCAFGLEKFAAAPPALTGMDKIRAMSAVAPAQPGIPQMQPGTGTPPVGGPGMAPGFGGGGLALDMPISRSQESLKPGGGSLRAGLLPQSTTGVGSIPGQAAIAERAATAVPMRFNLPNKLAAFLIQ